MTIRALLSSAAAASLLLACGGPSAPADAPSGAAQSNLMVDEDASGEGPKTSPAAKPAPSPAEQAPVAKQSCPDGTPQLHDEAERAETIAAWEKTFADAEAILDGCDESCRMTSNGNGATQLSMNSLMALAVAGYLPAQSRYGRELFTTLMTTGDEPELETRYVAAIQFLRLAAQRGDAAASQLIPGLAKVELTDQDEFVPEMPVAFQSLERSWVVEAFRHAESLRPCYPPSGEALPLP